MQTIINGVEVIPTEIDWLAVGSRCTESTPLPNADNATNPEDWHLVFTIWDTGNGFELHVDWREQTKAGDPHQFYRADTYNLGTFTTSNHAKSYAHYVYKSWNEYGNFAGLPLADYME